MMQTTYQRNQVAEAIEQLGKFRREEWQPYFVTLQYPKSQEFVSLEMAEALYSELGIDQGAALIVPEHDRQNQRLKGDLNYARTHLHAIVYSTEDLSKKVKAFQYKKGKVYAKLKKVWCMNGLVEYLSKQAWVESLPVISLRIHTPLAKPVEKAKPQAAIAPVLNRTPKPEILNEAEGEIPTVESESWGMFSFYSFVDKWKELKTWLTRLVKRLFNPLE